MGTKAIIGLGKGDVVEFVGCSYGSTEDVLPVLSKYKSQSEVQKLIDGGRIIEVESTLNDEEAQSGYFRMQCAPAAGVPSYFHEHQPFMGGYTWDDVKPQTVSIDEFLSQKIVSADDFEASVYYLFDAEKGQWSYNNSDEEWVMLDDKSFSGDIQKQGEKKICPVHQAQLDLIHKLDMDVNDRKALSEVVLHLFGLRDLISSKRIASEQGEERWNEAWLIQRIHAVIFGDDASIGSCFIPSASGLCGTITQRVNEIGHFVYQNLSATDVQLPACFEYAKRDFDDVKSIVLQIMDEERFALLYDRADTVNTLPWGYTIDFKKPFVSDFEKDTTLFETVSAESPMAQNSHSMKL